MKTIIIAASTCSNPSAFTQATTDAAEEIRCHEIPQFDVTPELLPELQAQ